MYFQVLMMFLAAASIGVLALVVGGVLGPKRANEVTLEPFESGNPVEDKSRQRFPIHFYLVAMLFIIFDIETAFFYPLAVKFRAAPVFLYVNAIVFVAILAVGYIYILLKGVLDWK